jgi:N12 class adenine-specific DNA methylase
MPASDVLKQVLEQWPVRVTDEGEDNRRLLNPTETAAAQEKAQLLQERFSEWVWEEPERATGLIDEYNPPLQFHRGARLQHRGGAKPRI